MTFKSTVRQALLAPIWPRPFRAYLFLLRAFGILPKRTPTLSSPERVLIVNLTSNLGDVIMMLPLIDSLHRLRPDAVIDVVVQAPMDVPLRAISFVRTVYSFTPGRTRVPLAGTFVRVFRMFEFARRELREQKYDLALLPRWGQDPSLANYVAAMTAAGRRCGHAPEDDTVAGSVLPGMSDLLTDVSHGGAGMAEGVREQLLLRACGLQPDFYPEVEERKRVECVLEMGRAVDLEACLERLGIPLQQPLLLLAPGASHPVRCWPPERFAELGRRLHRETGLSVYAIGGPGDTALCEQVGRLSEGCVRSVGGRTSINEAIALTGRAHLLVTNDSGPAHVGGAVGIPTLVLSPCPATSTEEHSNSPLRVRPVGPHVRVLQPDGPKGSCVQQCRSDTAHCILGLSVNAVFDAAWRLISYADPTTSAFRIDRKTTAGAPAATL